MSTKKKQKDLDKPKNKGGRPKEKVSDKVDFEYLLRLASAGLTDKQIGVVLGVTEMTVCRWKADEGFMLALKKGKELADNAVVRSLWARATGYTHPAIKIMQYEGSVITEEYTEYYPPDPVSCIFWLKNRRPSEWRDKQFLEHSGLLKNAQDMTDAEIEAKIAALTRKANVERARISESAGGEDLQALPRTKEVVAPESD